MRTDRQTDKQSEVINTFQLSLERVKIVMSGVMIVEQGVYFKNSLGYIKEVY